MPKKKKDKEKPDVNPELEGYQIEINEFGEIKSNMDIEELNAFLNRHVDDKKLREKYEKEGITPEWELNDEDEESDDDDDELNFDDDDDLDIDNLDKDEPSH